MPDRRAVLKLAAGAAALAAPLAAAAAPTPAAPAAVPPAAARTAAFYLVNGWVLTRADLEALDHPTAARPLA
jgi:hypothetical protein